LKQQTESAAGGKQPSPSPPLHAVCVRLFSRLNFCPYPRVTLRLSDTIAGGSSALSTANLATGAACKLNIGEWMAKE
jgi:hypothetical protein